MFNHFHSFVRLIIIYVLRLIMHILHIFPIKNNRVVINSYRGQQYACNPKYISKQLVLLYPKEFEIVWAFNEPNKFEFLKDEGIILVKYGSIKYFYYEATAKISINNIGSFSWNPTRSGQEHINTWHAAVNYKEVALGEVHNDKIMKKTLLMTSKETTVFLASCRYFYENNLPEDFGYSGYVLKRGLPRNDRLYSGIDADIVKKIKKKYSISNADIVVLYAPTWRYDAKNEIPEIDFLGLIKAVENRFNKPCTIIYRAHHITGSKGITHEKVIDVTEYPDSQEIMMAADILVTDYSSMIWDYSLTKRPCFLFVPDMDEYISVRGFTLPIEKWGFPICKTNEMLVHAIRNYKDGQAAQCADNHHKMLGSYETGHASESVCKFIYNKCFLSE